MTRLRLARVEPAEGGLRLRLAPTRPCRVGYLEGAWAWPRAPHVRFIVTRSQRAGLIPLLIELAPGYTLAEADALDLAPCSVWADDREFHNLGELLRHLHQKPER